jgi:hypothetical protein
VKLRSFGKCYVCGKAVVGYRTHPGRPYATSTRARFPVSDERGIRHSYCYKSSGRGQATA